MNPKNIFSRNANKIPLFFYQLLDYGLWTRNLFLRRYPRHVPSDHSPFFIIGSGRSGTTLLRSILIADGSIAIPPESFVIFKVYRKFHTYAHLGWRDLSRLIIAEFESQEQFRRWNTNVFPCYQEAFQLPENERSLSRLIEIVFRQYMKDNNQTATMWGDKTPLNTYYYNWMLKLYPHAKYIHMLRDGRDVVASLIKSELYSDVQDACWRWTAGVKRAQKLGVQVSGENFLEIRYEDLVRNTEDEVKRLCFFLDIPFSAKMLNPQQTAKKAMKNTIAFAHHKNLLNPINSSSIGKWEKELDKEQKDFVFKKMGKMLKEQGYM